jgi:hypothetical protein
MLSLVVLIPCFWQRRIEASDLGSHVYNAWLAKLIVLGRAPGLTIAPITTNVLFDLILSVLYRWLGADGAQRAAVSLAVLIFFWGAFALIETLSGKRPWYLAAPLTMLAYGWVFHMGFFNFYLAAGLSLWAVTLSLRPGRFAHLAAAALLLIAYTGLALAPVWALGVIIYIQVFRKLGARSRLLLLASAIFVVAGLGFWLKSRYPTFSSVHQVLEASAIDQVWVFGLKYWAISVGLALLWSFLLLGILYTKSFPRIAENVCLHLCLLMAVGILALPTRIELPQYHAAFSFITERMTLLHAVLICAFLATANPPVWLRSAFVPLALVYFTFLYSDTRAFNRVESSMETLTAPLSTTERVFLSLDDPFSRVQPWSHMLDRVCLERCLSYANYEPYSGHFRIRSNGWNPIVVSEGADFKGLTDGGYVVKSNVLPFYQIALCDESRPELCLKRLSAGDVTGHSHLSVAPANW